MVEFHETCKKAGITGIIGMEAYVVPNRMLKDKSSESKCNWHLVLLAKNAEGVKNLLRIHNDAQINGMHYKPRTDYSMLEEYGKNIIALSGCVGGEIPQHIFEKDAKATVEAIRRYQSYFDEFYLEIQPGHFNPQRWANSALVQIAHKMDVPLVATNDIHYLNKEDYVMHDLHVKSCRGQKVEKTKGLAYPDKCYYLMSEEELNRYFLRSEHVTDKDIEEAIANTNRIASQCDGEVNYRFEMPKYPDLPPAETEEGYLVKLCQAELKKRMPMLKDPVQYEERLMYELDVILKLGFSGYFLIVKDFLDHAREIGVSVGPGRGSVGGSLVAWLLNITVADPVEYNLMFERFLNPHQKGWPDIDCDFSDTNKMKNYIIEKYGEDHTALVGSFVIQKAKAAIHAAARLMDVDLDTANDICKAAPFRVTDDNGEEVKSPTIQQMLDNSAKFRSFQVQYPELFKMAMDIESFPKTYGIHAAGIVISPESILDKIPIRVDKDTGRYTEMWMLDPNTSFGEPNSATKEEDLVRIDHATDLICKIISAIADKKKHPVNVLMSRGNYEPSAITKMKADLGDNVRIYGMYDKQTLIQNMDMRLRMEKCCFGDSKDYNIRNKVFDIAFQRFGGSRDYDQEYVSTAASAESPVTKDIGRFWRYLAPGGILLYLMPSFLLRNKERKSIASKFQYLWSLQVRDKAFNLNKEIVALRKSENHDSDKEYEAVTNRVPAEALDDEMIDQAVEDVPLEDLGEVNLFNGPEDDLLIIQIALNSSTLKLKDDDERHRSIDLLLPLKKGQIGQIIASGRLNGVIDEGNGFKHVISGRVVKSTVHTKTEDYDDPNNAVKEDITKDCNQIEITAIGGDGDIRQLTVAA